MLHVNCIHRNRSSLQVNDIQFARHLIKYSFPFGLQKKTKRLKEVSDVVAALDGQALTESKTLNLASHTVTITDVSSVDFIGSTGVMLGSNTDTQVSVKHVAV